LIGELIGACFLRRLKAVLSMDSGWAKVCIPGRSKLLGVQSKHEPTGT
jgi:hypothetical protein